MKPIGIYNPGASPPSWARFGTIADVDSDAQWADALTLSRERGFLWLLQLGFHEPAERPIGPHARDVRARLDAAGLMPYVAAMAIGEEWYERWRGGAFTSQGVPPTVPDGWRVVHDWLGRQHRAAVAHIPRQVAWITGGVGEAQPVPAGVDVVLLEAYTPDGGTFETHVRPYLEHSEAATALPLAMICQWFKDRNGAHGGAWVREPRPEDVTASLRWALDRPRYLAVLGFTWGDRATLYGLKSLPRVRAAVEAAIGEK